MAINKALDTTGHEMTESNEHLLHGENLTKALVVGAHIAAKAIGHLSLGFRFSLGFHEVSTLMCHRLLKTEHSSRFQNSFQDRV